MYQDKNNVLIKDNFFDEEILSNKYDLEFEMFINQEKLFNLLNLHTTRIITWFTLNSINQYQHIEIQCRNLGQEIVNYLKQIIIINPEYKISIKNDIKIDYFMTSDELFIFHVKINFNTLFGEYNFQYPFEPNVDFYIDSLQK